MPIEVLENLEFIYEDYSIGVNEVVPGSTQVEYILTFTAKAGYYVTPFSQIPIALGNQITTLNVVIQDDGTIPSDYVANIIIGIGEIPSENQTKIFEVHFFEFPYGEIIDLNNLESYGSQTGGNSLAKKKTRTINYTRSPQIFPTFFSWLKKLIKNFFRPQKR